MQKKFQLSILSTTLFLCANSIYAIDLTENDGDTGHVNIYSTSDVNIYTDTNGYHPEEQYFNVYNGDTKTITSGVGHTTISTDSGSTLQLSRTAVNLSDLVITGVSDGTISDTSTNAINGSQLYDEQQSRVAADEQTLTTANQYTDSAISTALTNAGVDANALSTANEYADTAVAAEAQARIDGDAETLASANTYTDNTATTLRSEAATESARVDTAISNEAQARINGDAATLSSANSYTDTRVNSISRRLDDVEKTAYRGVAIALAAQQQVPNVKPGQVALFGGVGHYESETAGAVGLVGVLKDGRTSISSAIGLAGSGEIGARVGVAYVFGGN